MAGNFMLHVTARLVMRKSFLFFFFRLVDSVDHVIRNVTEETDALPYSQYN